MEDCGHTTGTKQMISTTNANQDTLMTEALMTSLKGFKRFLVNLKRVKITKITEIHILESVFQRVWF